MKLNIPKDKIMHIAAGFVITIIAIYIFVGMNISPIFGFVTGVIAGILKEAYDEHIYGGGDFFDFFATALGSVVAVFVYGLINNIV